jgi:hypothetical protein
MASYVSSSNSQSTLIIDVTSEEAKALPFVELEIDTATGDLAFPPRLLVGAAAIAQRLRTRLLFFKKEWFLDQRQGMPYYEQILVKNPDLTLVQSIFRRAILSTPGVLSISRFGIVHDTINRVFTLSPLEIVVTGGLIFRAQPDEFIIQVPVSE